MDRTRIIRTRMDRKTDLEPIAPGRLPDILVAESIAPSDMDYVTGDCIRIAACISQLGCGAISGWLLDRRIWGENFVCRREVGKARRSHTCMGIDSEGECPAMGTLFLYLLTKDIFPIRISNKRCSQRWFASRNHENSKSCRITQIPNDVEFCRYIYFVLFKIYFCNNLQVK